MTNKRITLGRRDFFKLTGGAVGIAALSYYLGITDRSAPPAATSSLPDYADSGLSFPIFRAPYLQKDVNLGAFVFRADVSTLMRLCDQTLNSSAASPYTYIPLTSTVILVYADMLVSSLDERDTQVGFIPETEIGFWMLTVAMKKTSNGNVPHHLAWFLPFLFVDESNSIATGREVYGFNKQAGEFVKPQDITAPQLAADVLGFEKFSPLSIAQKTRLLELNAATAETTQSTWNDWTSAQTELMSSFLLDIRPDLASGMAEFLAHAVTDHIPLVFLKQFRDGTDSRKACCKSIIEAPLKIKEFYAGAVFSHQYNLTINHLDSHPLGQVLGLKDQQTSTLSAWMKVDFVLEHGIEVWTA
jgi:hypothetical protein